MKTHEALSLEQLEQLSGGKKVAQAGQGARDAFAAAGPRASTDPPLPGDLIHDK